MKIKFLLPEMESQSVNDHTQYKLLVPSQEPTTRSNLAPFILTGSVDIFGVMLYQERVPYLAMRLFTLHEMSGPAANGCF